MVIGVSDDDVIVKAKTESMRRVELALHVAECAEAIQNLHVLRCAACWHLRRRWNAQHLTIGLKVISCTHINVTRSL